MLSELKISLYFNLSLSHVKNFLPTFPRGCLEISGKTLNLRNFEKNLELRTKITKKPGILSKNH